jgi:putative ABC transport system ATP-binding protein
MILSTERELAINCLNVEKEFRQGEVVTKALRGVDVQISTGEVAMLVGPSGCGKTTLISIIAGLLNRTAGTLEVLGTDPQKLSGTKAARFRRENIGFIFQQYNLIPALTAAENAALPLLAAGVSKKVATQRAEGLLSKLGLGEKVRAYPRQLSGGQQQRVAVARALVHEPRLILCDEPTAALDAESGSAVMALLRELALSPGRAVIVVTHDNRIYHFADRIIYMEDGHVLRVEEKVQG